MHPMRVRVLCMGDIVLGKALDPQGILPLVQGLLSLTSITRKSSPATFDDAERAALKFGSAQQQHQY